MGDVRQHVGKENVLASEDIALPDTPSLERSEMAGCDVVDVNEIEAGVDKSGHTPGRRLHDDPAGGRRPDVPRPDRRGRIDDDCRQAIPFDHRLHQALRDDLAPLVGADRRILGEGSSSVAGAPSAIFSVATLLV